MRRLYVPEVEEGAQTLSLPAGEAHHARTVLRAREGDRFEILNGQGRRLIGAVLTVSRQGVVLEIESESAEARPAFDLVLCQAVVKGKAMDWIVEKGTELGVSQILPVQCERSVSVGAKHERWCDLAISAMKQCGRAWLPEISTVVSLTEGLQIAGKCDQLIVASLFGERVGLWECLDGAKSVALWIGPEGDFTEREIEALREAGVNPVSLGPNVLRAETAALAGLSCIQHERIRQGQNG
ncbi:MAG: RsmE family RNA methyltransferase [Limisphaerales bacterium]